MKKTKFALLPLSVFIATVSYANQTESLDEIKITAEPRTDFGKGYARRIRAVGDIPAVIYGNGKEPKHVILPGHATTMAVRNKDVVLVIEVDGEQFKTRVQDIQRHPIRPELQHIDLLFVD